MQIPHSVMTLSMAPKSALPKRNYGQLDHLQRLEERRQRLCDGRRISAAIAISTAARIGGRRHGVVAS
eukprot:scaffold26664_cov163-Skeletonema_menzelii.AAC.9